MTYHDKTLNNIMSDLIKRVDGDMSTGEGTLIDHSFRGAAAEFEQVYIELGVVEQNAFAVTADREHLILRAKEQGVTPYGATNAVWKAEFNRDIPIGSRFSAKEMTYLCTEQIGEWTYRLVCEQPGTDGNKKKNDLMPVGYIDGLEACELTELLIPARDEEGTEEFRTRYFKEVAAPQATAGNREEYKRAMHGIAGVGACKIYRATKEERRIHIWFLNNLYQVPGASLVADVQEIMDPLDRQGEGEGKAAIFHKVDIHACQEEAVTVEAEITIENGYTWETMLPVVEAKLDEYFLELSKGWETTEYITVRILKINAAIAGVKGIIDVQSTHLNGEDGNLILERNTIPVRGDIICRQES